MNSTESKIKHEVISFLESLDGENHISTNGVQILRYEFTGEESAIRFTSYDEPCDIDLDDDMYFTIIYAHHPTAKYLLHDVVLDLVVGNPNGIYEYIIRFDSCDEIEA